MKVVKKPFSCGVCKKTFSILSSLTEHVKTCIESLKLEENAKSETHFSIENDNFFKSVIQEKKNMNFEDLILPYLNNSTSKPNIKTEPIDAQLTSITAKTEASCVH